MRTKITNRIALAIAALLLVAGTTFPIGCALPVNAITISLNPSSATVITGQQEQFSVYANGEVITTGIAWEVNGVASGNTTAGTISVTGLYTAPATVPSPNTVTISAIEQGTNESLEATVTIVGTSPAMPGASISVSPTVIPVGGTATLTWSAANVTSCLINQQSTLNGITVGTAGSTVVSPTSTTPYQLNCTGPNGPASSQTTLTIQATTTIAVSITPTSGSFASGQSIQFSASVANDPSGRGVQWTSSLGNAPTATSLLTATYTAPSVTQSSGVNITAISVADPSVFAKATIIITPPGGSGGTNGGCIPAPASANPPQAGISPTLLNLTAGASQTFIATLSGDNVTSQAFTWSLKGNGDTANLGTITPTAENTAIYQAGNVSSLTAVQIIATSAQYTCIIGYATVDVAP